MIVEPRATYRVQLRPDFTFDHASGVLAHLSALGISHLYTSPVLEAVPGSTHGYDVTDHSRVRHELGGEDGLARLVGSLRSHGMGWVVDIVPNHMSVAVPRSNPRWWDVLTHGADAGSAVWFDIDWTAGQGRVVLPVLGASLEDEVERGALVIRADTYGAEADVVVAYHDLELPVRPGTADLGDVGAGSGRLQEILRAQTYRVSHWRARDRNYRVFFDIDSLAALRVDDDEVFEGVHERLRDWVDRDLVDGVRVDHVDGLSDPEGYLYRLRDLVGPDRGLWIEKILMPGETLPGRWPVDGTTGYEFARLATGVAVEPRHEPAFDDVWRRWSGDQRDYEDHEAAAKREVLLGGLEPDVRRVERTAIDTWGAGETGEAGETGLIGDALVELAVALPVYRTYGTAAEPLDTRDKRLLDAAADLARQRQPGLASAINRLAELITAPAGEVAVELRARFQQLTGPAMAKGAEDTAFYRYLRLVALNEVGSDPGRFGATPSELHELAAETAVSHPRALLPASTHDTKRSADVRFRLAGLSHDPRIWFEALDRWRLMSEPGRPPVLDGATEYLLWQTVVGAWPLSEERLVEYLLKAAREAGVSTSWIDSNTDYEDALRSFAAYVVASDDLSSEVDGLVGRIAPRGRAVRLAEIVVRLTSPGIPDVYQGDQDWDFSLVDPDNRRAVDHGAIHQRMIRATGIGDVDELGTGDGSLAKLWITQRLLDLRRERPEWFGPGSAYEPVAAVGPGSDGIVAYQRGDGGLVVAVDARARRHESNVRVPEGRWRCVLRADHRVDGGRPVPAGDLWPTIAVTALVPEP